MNKGVVHKILSHSSVDGPGNRVVIFMQGCNFDCLYCHNPETIGLCDHCGLCVDACPYKALSLNSGHIKFNKKLCQECDRCINKCEKNSSPKTELLFPIEIVERIKPIMPFISGITVSGGECTLHLDFLIELFSLIKSYGLTTFVDSNGSIDFSLHEKFLSLCDNIILDVKSYDPVEHQNLTKQGNKIVLNNLSFLASIEKLYEVRTVIVPDILNNINTVDEVSKIIARYNPNIRYKLIRYRDHGVRKKLINTAQPSLDYMEKLKQIAKNSGCKNVIIV